MLVGLERTPPPSLAAWGKGEKKVKIKVVIQCRPYKSRRKAMVQKKKKKLSRKEELGREGRHGPEGGSALASWFRVG